MSSILQLRLAGDRLRADHAVHPFHVLLHARDDGRPLGGGVAARIGQHVALAAGKPERLARRRIDLGNLLRVERALRVLAQVRDDGLFVGGRRRFHARHHFGHQLAHVSLAFHARHHALRTTEGQRAASCIAGLARLWHCTQ